LSGSIRSGCQTVGVGAVVSVVIPVFNGMAHLPQAVDSVLRQSHAELDVVLVDGGSTDGSREWIHQVGDPRVRSLVMPPGITAADNWTEASLAARGDFVKLLCQDDVLYPTSISDQLADLAAHPDALFAVAQRDIVDADGRMLYRGRGCTGLTRGLMDGHAALRAAYVQGTNVFGEPLAVLFRRPVLDAALRWNDERPFLLDLELYTRVLQTGPIAVRKAAIGAFRVSSSSWSTRLVTEQTEQIRAWQAEVEQVLHPRPTPFERARAHVMRHEQTLLRRTAYRVLKLRGAFHAGARG
jgi:glycosyltransferase involved in cell wall biosynthesis